MARPSKSVNLTAKNLTKKERIGRETGESILKGKNDCLTAPDYLSDTQKAIFNYIIKNLNASGILGNLDIYILSTCCIAIDRLQYIETQINRESDLLSNSSFMSSKEKYTKDLYRCCNELSLSPQSRAKLASINVQQEKENPLIRALTDDG